MKTYLHSVGKVPNYAKMQPQERVQVAKTVKMEAVKEEKN